VAKKKIAVANSVGKKWIDLVEIGFFSIGKMGIIFRRKNTRSCCIGKKACNRIISGQKRGFRSGAE
jgi:hypothetical protein